MALFVLGPVLAIVIIALGVAFGILLAKRLEGLSLDQALARVFWKPFKIVVLGIAAFALAGWAYLHFN